MEREKYVKTKSFWENSALQFTEGKRPTVRDPFLQTLLEDYIVGWLSGENRMLDLGCGDGGSTIRFAREVAFALGVDYIDKHVDIAKENARKQGAKNADFVVGDVLEAHLLCAGVSDNQFDVVSTIRCLINLPDWESQKKAIASISKCIKPGGLYIASESWADGVGGLNQARAAVGLPAFEVVEYNTYISRADFENEVSTEFDIVDFYGLGFYMFMSRVFQTLFVLPENPSHMHRINRVAAELLYKGVGVGAFDECDTMGIYVLRKK